MAALAKGYSPKVDSALIIRRFWTACARWRCGAWPNRIESSANIADGASRNDFSLMKEIGSTKVPPATYYKVVIYPPPPSERRGRQHCRRCGRASTPAAPAKVHPPEPGESVAAGGKSHIVGGKLERARGDSPHKTARRIRVSLRAVLEGCARQADPLLFWARANELCFAHPPLGRTERDSSDETAHRSRVSNIVKVWRVVLATRLCRHG